PVSVWRIMPLEPHPCKTFVGCAAEIGRTAIELSKTQPGRLDRVEHVADIVVGWVIDLDETAEQPRRQAVAVGFLGAQARDDLAHLLSQAFAGGGSNQRHVRRGAE